MCEGQTVEEVCGGESELSAPEKPIHKDSAVTQHSNSAKLSLAAERLTADFCCCHSKHAACVFVERNMTALQPFTVNT